MASLCSGLGVTFYNWNQAGALAYPSIDTWKLPCARPGVSGSAARPQVNIRFSLSPITSLCPPSCLDLSLSLSPW